MRGVKNRLTNYEYVSDLNSFNDVATYLETTTGHLCKVVINNKVNNYTEFNIPKKDGTLRTIGNSYHYLSLGGTR